jgi:polyisoprenoid-binding protein YceI
MMQARTVWLAGALMLVAGARAWAQQSIPPGKLVESTLSFDGRATAGDFVGTTTTVSGEMTGGAGVAAVRGWVEAPVATLKTGNDHRDRDLNKSMETDKFPTMRFDLEAAEAGAGTGDSMPVTLKGKLTLHGVERAVELPGSVVFAGDRARVRTDFPLNLKDYKIGGLSKMLGMLKMHEDITVHVDVTFSSATQ